ncbi:MAG: hypothetical protein DWG76_02190 [Chloroflexi bacterium]|nr:hypothetical protein [Chloroflexota bacterium]
MLVLVGIEFYTLGYGSGRLVGSFSAKWAMALSVYLLLALALFGLAVLALYQPNRLSPLRQRIQNLRARLGRARWIPTLLIAALPAWFVFFSPWGALFVSLPTRFLIFALALLGASLFIERDPDKLLSLPALLLAGLFIGVLLTLTESFSLVSAYPFSQHWSEGNRIWDYSVLFDSGRYNYPAGKEIFAFIDRGRQALWGLPFLIPDVSIQIVRLWGAILVTLPYALLGWIAFRPLKESRSLWALTGLWALIFLSQGPIYTPLVLSAILVAGARRRPLWVALPLVFLAGHYAGVSRFSWRFAPGMWAVMLALGDAVLLHAELRTRDWLRAIALGLAGIWSKGLPILIGVASGLLASAPAATSAPRATAFPVASGPLPTPTLRASIETLEGLTQATTRQDLLWYRLLPNEVYAPGILFGLLLATLPLILLLIYAIHKGVWKTTLWQRVFTVGGLLAFLVVGIIASAKIGGGADLHNLDMFLLALILVAGLAWEAGLHGRLLEWLAASPYVRGLLAVMVLIPAFWPIVAGRPPERLDPAQTQWELERLQERVACAAQHGDVLLMDQRQLLTFGELGDLPLVVEYEKKYVMNQALSDNEAYFDQFRTDLEAGRFAMILTERQALRYKYSDADQLGDSLIEENNAWVRWVTVPLLDYYESVANRREAAIQLFVPIDRDFDC